MKRFIILAWAFAFSGLAISVVHAAAKDSDKKSSKNVVAVFRLHGPIVEAPPAVDFSLNGEEKTLFDWTERLRKAKKDENLKAVVLVFDEPTLGTAQIQEMRAAIKDLRSADKEVYAYLETVQTGAYMLATAASKIVMVPSGDLNLLGIKVEQTFFKGLMDKLGLEADIEHVGAYKGAGEPFTRTSPSKESKEMMEWLVKDFYSQVVDTIAEARQLDPGEVRKLIDQAPFTAKKALEAKLVDELAYAEDFTESLQKKYGPDAEFNHDYGAKKGPELDFSNIFSLFQTIGKMMNKARDGGKSEIAVVYVEGMIVTGKAEEGLFGNSENAASTTLRRTLAKARDDDDVKAVVLRVNSPGGSALASDIIWHAAQELKGKKPFIVSMGNVAASGGYYVSAGAMTIFADPGTITGSIGVIGGKIVTKGLWDWVGITFDQTKMGENADLYGTDSKFTDQQRVVVKKMMLEVYGEFTDRVTQGRGKKLKKDLEELAGGRVYTGKQAQELGLVDKMGGLRDAIAFAAAEANVSDYDVLQMPEPRNFMDVLLEGLSGEKKDKDSPQISLDSPTRVQLGAGLQNPNSLPASIRSLMPMLGSLDPERVTQVTRSLMRIDMLGREGVLLATPTEINIR